MKPPTLRSVLGAPSWTFSSDCVTASVTRGGGHLAPVQFKTARGTVQPFAIAPWAGKTWTGDSAPVLRTLRGDFFCAPFGGNERPWRGEQHPAHGETAGGPWVCEGLVRDGVNTELIAHLQAQVRPGKVTKRIRLRDGETNVYCLHSLSGFSGPMPLGHHANLAFLDEYGPGQIVLAPFHEGHVTPRAIEDPAMGGYSALKTGGTFRSLKAVPLAAGGRADLSVYPAREGFEDIVMVSTRDTTRLSCNAVVFPQAGWLWFALKDPQILASTVLWHSNGGRHYPPWSGRHRRVLGLEDVTAYFHFGLADSAEPNPLAAAGVPTAVALQRNRIFDVPYVMGVVALPDGFDRLARVRVKHDHLLFTATTGASVRHPVDLSFFTLPND